jgi:hypothetical protein
MWRSRSWLVRGIRRFEFALACLLASLFFSPTFPEADGWTRLLLVVLADRQVEVVIFALPSCLPLCARIRSLPLYLMSLYWMDHIGVSYVKGGGQETEVMNARER